MNIEALEGLTPEMLLQLDTDAQETVIRQIAEIRDYVRFNKLHFHKPSKFQEKFVAAGKEYKTRFLRAGNRCGKTYGTAAEFATHITGEYPADWQGEIVKGSGHTFWVIGITLDSARRVIQKELFGTNDCTDKELVGTGMIPKRCIIRDRGWVPDGKLIRECLIQHKDGGVNTLMFFGSENEAVMMGAKVRFAWMDEENPHTSMQIYSQIQTRLLNAAGNGENGSLIITATPEGGLTPLNATFEKNEGGKLYLQGASMDDNPYMTQEQIEEYLATIPAWQRAMRRDGVPVLGDHAVFQFDDNSITEENTYLDDHWRLIWGIDSGEITDPSVLILCGVNEDTGQYRILREHYLDSSVEARGARNIANIILNSEFSAVPVITPPDMGINSQDPEAKAKQLERLGVNVIGISFQNPPETSLSIQYADKTNKSARKIATGLNEMCFMFEDGTLKVSPTCFNWFKEKHGYYLKINKNTGRVDYAGADHAIDASRYGVMSLKRGLGCRWSERGDRSITQYQGFDTVQFNY